MKRTVNYANAVSRVTVNGTAYSSYYDVYEDDAKSRIHGRYPPMVPHL